MGRTAPSVQVVIDRFAVWTAVVAVLSGFAAFSLLIWVSGWAGFGAKTSPDNMHWFALAVSAGVVLVGGWSCRLSAVSLRWDGERWWLGRTNDIGTEPWGVQPFVRLDLGAWMLLQLQPHPDGPRPPNRYRWLPIERTGLGPQWHGLRCALYAGRDHRGGRW
jgi:hypothetical protein